MEFQDYLTMKSMENGFSPYEQVKIGYMQQKHAGGTAIGGLVTAVGAAVVGLGGWFWAASQAKNAKDIAIAKNDGLRDLVTTLAATVAAERNERLQGDFTLNQTITDTVSGQQASTLTAQQAAELSAIQTATNTVTAGLMTGQYSQNPQKVAIWRDAQACPCPGCGCNG